MRVYSIKQVLKRSFVRIIRKINKLLKFFFKSVSKKTIVNTSYPRNTNSVDTKEFHLVRIETWTNKIQARCEPLISYFTFFNPNISSSVQFSQQSVNILFSHSINLFPQSFINSSQILEIFMLIMHPSFYQSFLSLQITQNTFPVSYLQRITILVIWTISNNRNKFISFFT